MKSRAIVIDFSKMKWSKVSGGGRVGRTKEKIVFGNTVRLLEFNPKWNEITWCEKKHSGYVLSGNLNLELQNSKRKAIIKKGQGFVIPKKTPHRASCKSKTLVFVVD